MDLPESVYQLLPLLELRSGGIRLAGIPPRLRNALNICLGHDPPLAQRYACGAGNPPVCVKLTPKGRAVLALYRETGGRQAEPEAESEPKPKAKPEVAGSEASLDARALALFIEDTTRTKTKIAKLLHRKNVQSLAPARCPNLAAAMGAFRAKKDPGRRVVRGSKDSEGNLEAYESE